MFMASDPYNSTAGTEEWVNSLHNSHSTRSLIKNQFEQFYIRRRAVEYGVKTTITASMATALIWGGPPFWIIGGAALMLKITTLTLQYFNPSQYVEEPSYQAKSHTQTAVDRETLEDFRFKWNQNHENNLFSQHKDQLCSLQKRIALALIVGFVIFTVLNANLTAPIIIASLLYAATLIEQSKEEHMPYVEEEEKLSLSPRTMNSI